MNEQNALDPYAHANNSSENINANHFLADGQAGHSHNVIKSKSRIVFNFVEPNELSKSKTSPKNAESLSQLTPKEQEKERREDDKRRKSDRKRRLKDKKQEEKRKKKEEKTRKQEAQVQSHMMSLAARLERLKHMIDAAAGNAGPKNSINDVRRTDKGNDVSPPLTPMEHSPILMPTPLNYPNAPTPLVPLALLSLGEPAVGAGSAEAAAAVGADKAAAAAAASPASSTVTATISSPSVPLASAASSLWGASLNSQTNFTDFVSAMALNASQLSTQSGQSALAPGDDVSNSSNPTSPNNPKKTTLRSRTRSASRRFLGKLDKLKSLREKISKQHGVDYLSKKSPNSINSLLDELTETSETLAIAPVTTPEHQLLLQKHQTQPKKLDELTNLPQIQMPNPPTTHSKENIDPAMNLASPQNCGPVKSLFFQPIRTDREMSSNFVGNAKYVRPVNGSVVGARVDMIPKDWNTQYP